MPGRLLTGLSLQYRMFLPGKLRHRILKEALWSAAGVMVKILLGMAALPGHLGWISSCALASGFLSGDYKQ